MRTNIDREQALKENIPLVGLPPDAEILDEVPDWMVRHLTKPAPKGGIKFERVIETYNYNPGFGAMYCEEDVDDSGMSWLETKRAEASKALSKKGRRHRENSAPVPGNLPWNDYRYWTGARNQKWDMGTCRWCGRFFGNQHDREMHFSEKGNECTRALVTVFNYARSTKPMYCMVCGKRTDTQKWGLPMCCRVTCVEGWMFTASDALEVYKQCVVTMAMRSLLAPEYISAANKKVIQKLL